MEVLEVVNCEECGARLRAPDTAVKYRCPKCLHIFGNMKSGAEPVAAESVPLDPTELSTLLESQGPLSEVLAAQNRGKLDPEHAPTILDEGGHDALKAALAAQAKDRDFVDTMAPTLMDEHSPIVQAARAAQEKEKAKNLDPDDVPTLLEEPPKPAPKGPQKLDETKKQGWLGGLFGKK